MKFRKFVPICVNNLWYVETSKPETSHGIVQQIALITLIVIWTLDFSLVDIDCQQIFVETQREYSSEF